MAAHTLIIYVIALAALIAGSFQDLRKREVADWLNYGLIMSGLMINLIAATLYGISFIISSVIGLVFASVIGLSMFYSGQWGGGDTKMLIGLGALIGIDYSSLASFNLFSIPFLINLIINIILAGSVYGLLWSAFLALRNRKKFMKELRRLSAQPRIKAVRTIVAVVAFTIIILMILSPADIFLLSIILFLAIASLYLWIFAMVVEKSSMYRYLSPSELTEGDWIAKKVRIKNRVVYEPEKLGITLKNIRLLRRLDKNKSLKILVKEGIPFVPSFLIAFILTMYCGNLLLLLL